MKIRILPTLVLSFLALSVLAQPKFKLYPDSIRVEMPEQNGLVVFEFKEFTKSEAFVRNFGTTLRETLEIVRKSSSSDLTTSEPLRVEVRTGPEGTKEVGLGVQPYGEKSHVLIRPVEPKQTVVTLLKDKGIVEMLPPGWEVILLAKTYRVTVYAADFTSLEQLTTVDFNQVADAIAKDEGMKTLGRKNIESQLILRNKQVEGKSIQYVFPGDQISLSLIGGVGVVQSTIYPEISARLGLTFRDRMRRPNFRTGLMASRMFMAKQTAEGFNLYSNSFLSATIEKNFERNSGTASWSGLGIGFLVRQEGNYFQGNTAKFFITHSLPGSRFSMVPEFYLTDNFKKFNFGMTLRYSF